MNKKPEPKPAASKAKTADAAYYPGNVSREDYEATLPKPAEKEETS